MNRDSATHMRVTHPPAPTPAHERAAPDEERHVAGERSLVCWIIRRATEDYRRCIAEGLVRRGGRVAHPWPERKMRSRNCGCFPGAYAVPGAVRALASAFDAGGPIDEWADLLGIERTGAEMRAAIERDPERRRYRSTGSRKARSERRVAG
jgi:hypothetical protein